MFEILWRRKAYKQLMGIGQLKDRKAIFDAVDQLKHFPESGDIKKLQNADHEYRLRVGRFRVLFDVEHSIRVISIEEVKKRDEQTY